jgi:hypothetical protein
MNILKKLFLGLFIICLPAIAHAATGGACPTTAQYLAVSDAQEQPSLATAPLVTLASLGVTQCFYITSGPLGNDSNTGTDEAHPWIHGPHMPNCLSSSACHITLTPGQGIIVQGGSHYHYFNGSPQVGLPAGWPTGTPGYAWNFQEVGAAGAEIYIGVDQGWFLGTSWSRPIFDNDNPIYSPPNPSPAQTMAGWASTAVASCAYPQGNLDDIVLQNEKYIQLDNFEFTGMCWNDVSTNGSNANNEHAYIKHFGLGEEQYSWRRITNMYWHGWSHTAFNATCSGPNPPGPSGTCGGPGAIIGGTQSGNEGTLYAYDICDGQNDSDPLAWSCEANDAYDMEEGVIRYSAPVNIFADCHTLHDNLFEHINNSAEPGAHTDLWFCVGEDSLGNNFYYNNLIRYVGTDFNQSGVSAVVWFGGTAPGATCGSVCTDYVYNNVFHDVNATGNYVNIGGADTGIGNGGVTNFEFYNNTAQQLVTIGGGGGSSPVWANINAGSMIYTSQNNHYIIPNSGTTANCTGVFADTTHVNGGNTSCSGDLFQTISVANGQGYNSANDFQPGPGGSTIGSGANETSISAPFGTAFLSTTTNGCAYIISNHTISCPAITPSARNTSPTTPLPWNTGAYGSGSGGSVSLSPSSYVFATTTIGSTSSDSPLTFTLSNGTASTLTGISISFTGANPSDFSKTTTCSSSLTASSSCSVFVSFTPTATGSRSGVLSITYSGGSVSSSLAGTGVGFITLSPSVYTFLPTPAGSPVPSGDSPASFVFTNNTGVTVTGITISISGLNAVDFSASNGTCTSTLVTGSSCTLTASFKPILSNTGSLTSTLNVAYSGGGPATATLFGISTSPSPAAVKIFGSMQISGTLAGK